MRFPFFILLLFTCARCSFTMAQTYPWVGGNADGFAYNTFIPSACPPLASTNISLGGNADGFAYTTFIPSACPPIPSTNISLGGNADGFAYNTFIPSACPPLPNTNISLGGDADGFAYNTFIPSVCPPLPNTNISLGGNADGFAYNTFIPSVCPPLPNTNISLGGNADGFAYNTFIPSACPPLASTNISLGGSADGLSYGKYIPSPCLPLPVELLLFTAECKEKKNFLKWVTASEQNSAYFTLERSTDAVNFFSAGTIAAAGNSSTVLDYSFTDSDPLPFAYYRLDETDFNGKTEIFSVIAVSCSQNPVEIYPTISDGLFYIHSEKKIVVSINNALGESIYSAEINPGTQDIDLHSQPGGLYFLNAKTEKGSFTQKIVILR